MTLETISNESSYLPHTLGEDGTERYAKEGRNAVYASYTYPKDGFEQVIADVQMDEKTGRIVSMNLTDIPVGWVQNETPRDTAIPDDAYVSAAQAFARERMGAYIADPDALDWRMHAQEEWWTNYGVSVCVMALIPETNERLNVFVGCADMQVHMVRLDADQRGWFEGVEFETDDMPMNG